MKILVTGGAGFIGSNFIRYWLKKYPQDKVTNLDALTYAGHIESLQDISSNPNYTFIKGDITDPQVAEKAVDGCDLIVHFAAETHVDRSIIDPLIFVKTNVIGTQVMLEAARKRNIRFHHISTDEVFGSLDLGTKDKFTPETPYQPNSPYSSSKASSDHLVRSYNETFGLPITITNCSNNFGPFQDPEKFLPRMITNLLDGKNIHIYGDGKNVRDWLHVIDHCSAIDKVVHEGVIGQTYTIGGLTEDIDNLTLAKKILSILKLPEDRIEFVKDRPGHDRRYAVDWTKMHHELGWSPNPDTDELLIETVKWYQDNEWWWRPLKEKSEQIYENKPIIDSQSKIGSKIHNIASQTPTIGLKKIRQHNIKLSEGIDLFRQTYEKPQSIEGAHIIKLAVHYDDYGGWFKESLRLDSEGNVVDLKEKGIAFHPIQMNFTNIAPGTQRFWHIHPDQNEIWTTNGVLLVGLIDSRDGSPSNGMRTKIILSPGEALFIPSGVAHGYINSTNTSITLSSSLDKHFVPDEDTEEYRIDPKDVSFDFVKPEMI